MQKAIVVSLMMIAMAGLAAMPAGSAEEEIRAGDGPITEELLLELVDGDPPATVDLYTWAGDEMVLDKTVTWDALIEKLEETTMSGEEKNHPTPCNNVGIYFCPDHGAGDGQTGFFCDDSSGWIAHSGAPGDTVLIAEDSGSAAPICGGFLGPAKEYTQFHMSPLAGGTVELEGCFADSWASGINGYCPGAFTGQDTFQLHFRAAGPGVVWSIDLPSGAFDVYTGLGSEVAYDHVPGDPV